MKDKILDAPFESPKNRGNLLADGETILWEGTPSWQHKSTLFEGNKKQKINLTLWLLGVISCFILYYFNIEFFIFFPFVVLGLILFILMELYLYRRKRKISYAITSDRVIFQYGELNNYHSISFLNIDSFSKMEHKNGIESIILKLYRKAPLHPALKDKTMKEEDITHKDAYRTLETIDEAKTVKELLQKGIDKYNNYRKHE